MITINLIFLLVALICFILAAVPPAFSPFSRFNLVPLGLAFWVLSILIAPR